jgi:glycosyltransferase involved in cell wall biosynthesis
MGYALRTAYHRVRGTITKNTSAYYSPSFFLKRKLVDWGIPEKKIAVISTPVQAIPYSPKPASSGSYVAYAGRISPEKGIDWLLSVAKRLQAVPFKIAGQISDHCRHMMKKLPANVTWVGELSGSDLDTFYHSARIVVIPSICYEVFPNVALEAMVRARPVVGSSIGGIPEIVEDGLTGLLVSPRNVAELVEKLGTLWSDRDFCDRIGAAGRIKALTDYSEETFYQHLMSLYGQVRRDYGSDSSDL